VDLTNRVVIVTGASRGLGRQIALEFGRRGAKVVIAARTVEPRRTLPGTVGETVALIERAGGEALAVQCDVANPADVEQLVTTSIDAFGRVDVVVNNAADMVGGDFEKRIEALLGKPAAPSEGPPSTTGPLDDWLQRFAINVHGPYLLTTLVTPHLRDAGGGVIVNITSGAAVAVVAIDPGGIRTEAVELLSRAGVISREDSAPMSVPVATVMEVVTAEDPMAYSGQVVRAQP